MERPLGAVSCLICFEMFDKNISVPSDVPAKIFSSCNTYLHSIITKDTLKDIQLNKKNQLPLCRSCFDSAWELTQLSEQLKTIQKDITDLTVAFSMAVFYRRSQIYTQMQTNSQRFNSQSMIEFNEDCLPLNLFSSRSGDQNIQQKKSNHDTINPDTSFDTQSDIVNVKNESNDLPFDNFSGNHQSSIADDNTELQFNKENIDNYGQPTIEANRNHALLSERRLIHKADRNDSETCTDGKSGMQLTMSELLKSVKMPEIILERINIESHKDLEGDASVVKPYQIKCEPQQNLLKEISLKNDEFTVHHYDPIATEGEKHSSSRDIHRKTHTGETHYRQDFTCKSSQIYGKTPAEKKSFQCSFCQKCFATLGVLKTHERIHTGEKPFKCSYCHKDFNSLGNMKLHERIHAEDAKCFKCSYCEKGFLSLPILQVHERIHTGEKPFQCSFCDKKCAQLSNLKYHERTHTGEKPFKCSFCEKCFISMAAMQYHERTHTGEKPFKCPFCEKCFISMAAMQYHERTHTGEKPFKCSFCEKCFISAAAKKYHQRSHTGEKPFKCSMCEKDFNSMAAMKYHETTHTGEKPFQCSYCEKSFGAKSTLQAHERRHTGEKPFQCLYCEKTFTQLSGKNSHEWKHRKKGSSFMRSFYIQKDGSLTQLKHQEQMHLSTPIEFKCSFCEMTFSQDQERIIHERTHSGEELVNEHFIVGI